MDRKMFKARKTSTIPAGDALSVWFSLHEKVPSVSTFAVILGKLEN